MRSCFVLLLTLSLAGCLKTRSELKGQTSDGSLRTGDDGRYVSGNVNQQQRAQIDSRFFEIDRDFRQLYGKIENLEKQVSDMNSKPAGTGGGAEANPESDKKLKEIEKRLGTLEEAIISLDKKISGNKSSAIKKKTKKPKGFFAQAEAYYAQGKYEKAIHLYDKYRKRFPKGRRYAQSTLKMGLCFQKLKMPQDAKPFYKEVIRRYPKTQTAKAANANLKSI